MKKTLLLLLAVLGLAEARGELVMHWATGVDEKGGWYDFDKKFDGRDNNMCWAAATASVVAWWQDRNKALALEAGAPLGDAVWTEFTSSFSNASGYPHDGMFWYFSGDMYESYIIGGRTEYGQEHGGYYKGLLTGEPGYQISSVMPMQNWGDSKLMSSTLCSLLDSGYGIALALNGVYEVSPGYYSSYGHAITLWGVEINTETGLAERMWITDSDDGGLYQGLVEVTCGLNDKGYLTFESVPQAEGQRVLYPMNEVYIANFYAVDSRVTSWAAPEVPEPGTGVLTLLGLAGAGMRRRRK